MSFTLCISAIILLAVINNRLKNNEEKVYENIFEENGEEVLNDQEN